MPDPSKAIYATGRRKHAVARVWLQPGSGKVDINRRSLEDYFGRETSRMVFRQALELTETTGRFDVFVTGATGAQPESAMAMAQWSLGPSDWSADGRSIACIALGGPTSWDIWILPTSAGEKPHSLIATPFREWEPRFSPDGRWVAYVSNESGRYEVLVRPFLSAGEAGFVESSAVSKGGGTSPRWSSGCCCGR